MVQSNSMARTLLCLRGVSLGGDVAGSNPPEHGHTGTQGPTGASHRELLLYETAVPEWHQYSGIPHT